MEKKLRKDKIKQIKQKMTFAPGQGVHIMNSLTIALVQCQFVNQCTDMIYDNSMCISL